MKRALLGVSLIASGLLGGFTAHAAPPMSAEQAASLPALVRTLVPEVVNITILKQNPRSDGTMAEGAADMMPPIKLVGSGFIIDADGYVLTNRHVVEGSYKVTVTLANERTYPAQVLATNDRPDLALLKIDTGYKLPTVKIGDSDALEIGETVIAIGNPLGLSSSVSVGIVSALNRDLNETMIDDFIQTDAAINHGNSGGPLFNARGEVIGVNTQLINQTDLGGSIGLGLSIPIKDAMFVAGEMRRFGRLKAGYLGVRLQQLTPEIAAAAGLTDISGGIVSAVSPGGPADKAGIVDGDVILQFGDAHTNDIRALLREIGQTMPGTTTNMRIWRDGKEVSVPVTLADWPNDGTDPAGPPAMPPRGERMQSPTLGMKVAELTPEINRKLGLAPTMQGVVVLAVAANSIGADIGFQQGDVLLMIDHKAVTTIDEIRAVRAAARAAGRPNVLMLVQGNGAPRWLVVPTDNL